MPSHLIEKGRAQVIIRYFIVMSLECRLFVSSSQHVFGTFPESKNTECVVETRGVVR